MDSSGFKLHEGQVTPRRRLMSLRADPRRSCILLKI